MSEQVTSAAEYQRQTRPIHVLRSKRKFRLKPPPPKVFIKGQRLPGNLLNRAAKLKRKDGETDADMFIRFLQEMTEKELDAFAAFACELVAGCCEEPRVVVGAKSPDEIEASKLEEGDFWEIYAWGMGVRPVRVGESEVSSDELEQFPDDGRGEESAGPVISGEALRNEPIQIVEDWRA